MQKKKKTTSPKTAKIQTSALEDASKLMNETPVQMAERRESKSILKPFAFFAVFVALVGAAMLYPYMKVEMTTPLPLPKPTEPTLNITKTSTEPITVSNLIEADTPLAEPKTEDCNTKDKLILSQKQTIDELNEKIHRLEMDKLNLNEKMAVTERMTPLTVRLMEELYTGHPFGTTLNALLMNDKNNPFGLMVQEKLGIYAATGLPTPENLKKLFNAQMKMAQDSFYVSRSDTSWNTELSAFFKSLIHVYPEQINPDEAQGINILFLARTQVDSNDFAGAIASVEKLPESARPFMNNFVQNAKRYLEGQHIINAYLQK